MGLNQPLLRVHFLNWRSMTVGAVPVASGYRATMTRTTGADAPATSDQRVWGVLVKGTRRPAGPLEVGIA